MIVETLKEELIEVNFVNPHLEDIGNKFLSVTFEVEDREEFLKSRWSKVTYFEEACKKYLALVR